MAHCVQHKNLSTIIYNLKINTRTEETAFLNWELGDTEVKLYKVSSRNQMSVMQMPLSRVAMTFELFPNLLDPSHLSKSKPRRGGCAYMGVFSFTVRNVLQFLTELSHL